MVKKKKTFPGSIFVYVCDNDGDLPILAVANSLDEIPEDDHGSIIATYELRTQQKLTVTRSLD